MAARVSASGVLVDLAAWGPDAAVPSPPALRDAEAYCRRLAETHYENFPVASRLLPRDLRQHFCNVYAWCRWADDLGDESGDCQRSLELLAWWREELNLCFQHRSRHPVSVALQRTIDQFDLPRQPFLDLISAFEQDQTVRDYQTFDALQEYCRRSADPVGRIVLHLCRAVRDETLRWSDSICTGLQLANFWQDVARDADIGRVYLPREDRERFGYTDAMLARRETNQPFVRLMQFQVERARERLLAGLPLVEAMTGRLQVDIDLFIRGGLAILTEIERLNHRVWEVRPVVSRGRFARLFVGSLLRCGWRRLRWGR